MRATRHRKDMGVVDFYLLARFSSTLIQNRCDCIPTVLGEFEMHIPVWTRSHSTGLWTVSKYKNVKHEALGITTDGFRRICRYIQEKEAKVIDTLFRFSILGVVPDQLLGTKLRFRQSIAGLPLNTADSDQWGCGEGFVVERRRILGDFRAK